MAGISPIARHAVCIRNTVMVNLSMSGLSMVISIYGQFPDVEVDG